MAAGDGNMDLIKLPAQECGYHVHVIWQCAVWHQRMISGAQYKDYEIDWMRHEFAGWAGRHHADAMANLPNLISTIICMLG